jgi:MerR family transcriptional regulator, light-induced transcriptional regulator
VIGLAAFPRPHREATRFESPIDPAGPVAQEWIVIVDAPSWAACLVARELEARHGRRRFESVWSMDRGVVRDAARLGVTIAARTEPGVTDACAPVLRTRPAPIDDGLQRATALTNRILGNLLRSAQRTDVRPGGSPEGRNVSP